MYVHVLYRYVISLENQRTLAKLSGSTAHVHVSNNHHFFSKGVVDYLNTEVATSKQKKFPFVTFIDTPGLVDGDMKYPFNVEEVLTWLGRRADLILVFFDPLGQALCKRTLDIVGECMGPSGNNTGPSNKL